MQEEVTGLLAALGYTELSDSDRVILAFSQSKVESYIKNEINWKEIPQGLEHVAICRILGEFLLHKKTFSPADLSMLDLSGESVKQIQAGDTNYVFAAESRETDEARLTALINHLLSYGENQFSAFRRIRW